MRVGATPHAGGVSILLVAALAAEVLIPYAAPDGKTEALARTIVAWGKRLVTVESDSNATLTAIGATVAGTAYTFARKANCSYTNETDDL